MPASSPSEIFSDFLGQLPLGLIVMVCASGILLFFAFAWFAYFKPLRNRRQLNATPANTQYTAPAPTYDVSAFTEPGGAFADEADMPDLDSLVDTRTLGPAPPTKPQVSTSVTQNVATGGTNGYGNPMRQQGHTRVQLNNGTVIDAEEIITVLRDPRDGRLVVQIDNTAYRTLKDTPDVKKSFLKVMRELSDVVNEPDDHPPVPEDDYEEAPSPEPSADEQPVYVPQPKIDLPPSNDGLMPGDLPSYKLDDSVPIAKPSGGLFRSAPKGTPEPLPELNIAASIESYLQHKLQFVPEYTGRQIHVHSAPGGGVRIQVDSTFYEAVGDVQEPDVRAFLQTTIEEWQERQ